MSAAQQSVHRLFFNLSAQIPKRQVDSADGVHDQAAAAYVIGALVHPLPQVRAQRIAPHQQFLQCAGVTVSRGTLDNGLNGGRERLSFSQTREPFVSVDDHDAIIIRTVK